MSPTSGNGELNYYKAAKEFMEDSFAAVNNQLTPLHLEKTADWILKLSPQADSAMLIAAVTHDIERAFREDLVYQKMFSSENAFQDRAFLDYHQQRSARIIIEFLKTLDYPAPLCDKVYHLVAHHETGGDPGTDLLKDADSLSFFQTNVDLFVTVKTRESSPEKVKSKFDWMFARISDPTAREICRPLYNSALTRLACLEE